MFFFLTEFSEACFVTYISGYTTGMCRDEGGRGGRERENKASTHVKHQTHRRNFMQCGREKCTYPAIFSKTLHYRLRLFNNFFSF